MKKAYFTILAFLATIGAVSLIFVLLIILQIAPQLEVIQRNILTSFLNSEKNSVVRSVRGTGVPSISKEGLLEEYSSITKKYIYLKNQSIEDLKSFDKLTSELNLKRKTIAAREKEIKALNFSITELNKELKQSDFSNKVLIKLNKQILDDFEEIYSFMDDLKKSEEQSLFELVRYDSISKLQVNKINFLLSRLEKLVSYNYKLIDSIGKKLKLDLDNGMFEIYKEKKNKFKNKLKASGVSELKKKEMELAFQLKNFQRINAKLEKFKALPLGWPVINKTRVTSLYGFRKDPINKQRKFHYGIDISGNISKKIVSTGDGTVVFAGMKGGYGLTITILHRDNYKSGYSHLNKIFVKTGDKLEKGDIIGLMGSTGRSTGVHLHYEIMKRDIKINPKKFLEAI